ncbi:hypothetical protein GCL60_07985 [Silvanigrella paludirubra]|uniref:Uncharacterized protein n=1 Tax=Silvanigrella paludirubra TaxID=2499159 RepID=A0A6N6VWE9_9BACT|nr:hypothetical protein [Silvanigrella paludirubra]KAB8038793.1 hypothetical protein GCL60_07985 [Silvanigrella paludirubra]
MKFIKILIYINFVLCSSLMAYADTADIYCANKNKETKWLYYNNDILKLNGEWQNLSKKINSEYRLIARYFKLNNKNLNLNEIQQLCVHSFGSDFQYVQASSGIFSTWLPVGIDDRNVLQGFLSLSYYCIRCLKIKTFHKSVNELSQKNNNIFEFIY